MQTPRPEPASVPTVEVLAWVATGAVIAISISVMVIVRLLA
jgi:hypothetical protein